MSRSTACAGAFWMTGFVLAVAGCHTSGSDASPSSGSSSDSAQVAGPSQASQPTTAASSSTSGRASTSMAGAAASRAASNASAASTAGTSGTSATSTQAVTGGMNAASGTVASSPQAGASGAQAGASAAAAGTSGTVTAPATLTLLDHSWFSGPELGYDMQWMDRPFDLGAGPFAKVTLTFQLESPCFPFDKWTDSPPPNGQMFPAKCDRFDRLMYFEIDPAAAPGLQVLRSITPYGGPLEKSVDITDFANTRPGPHSLRSFVGTWVDDQGQVSGADGGYFLTVKIETKPGSAAEHAVAVTSLYSGWVGVDTKLTDLPFTLPEGIKRAELAYLVTGHGGAMDPSNACIGAADEFCKRVHHISVDGVQLTPEGFDSPSFVPWRDDCGKLCTLAQGHPMMGAYCRENPNRMMGSVTASRANWCPGDAVAPIIVKLPAARAAAGQHTAHFAIDGIYPDGRWQVALAVYAYAD